MKNISFKPITRQDFPLIQKWLAEPHVQEWWHDDLDAEGIEAKYGPRVDGQEPSHVYIILHDAKPIGLIQWYLWSDYPEHATQLGADSSSAGMDLAIGEKGSLGKGIGTQIIRDFVSKIILSETNASAVITDPEEQNSRSLRAFEKAGFKSVRIVKLQGENLNRVVVGYERKKYLISKIPTQIINLIEPSTLEPDLIGESKSDVFKVTLSKGQSGYLKITSSAYEKKALLQEVKILQWLRPLINVPSPIEIVEDPGHTYFLMSAVEGKNLAQVSNELSAAQILRLGAQFLKKLHAIPTRDCPFDRRLNVTLGLAKKNLDAGLVDESDFDVDKKGLTGNEVLKNLLMAKPQSEDLVFTHGDYCFPNILYCENQISGVVDLSRAGIADRYQDISLFLRSFKYNMGSPDLELFCKEYGLKGPLDIQKMEFYRALDEFF